MVSRNKIKVEATFGPNSLKIFHFPLKFEKFSLKYIENEFSVILLILGRQLGHDIRSKL